jgi:uncharacterized protein
MGKSLKCSKFAFEYESREAVALYHSIFLKKVYGDKELFTLFRKFKPGSTVRTVVNQFESAKRKNAVKTITLLHSLKLLVKSNSDESDALNWLRSMNEVPPRTNILLIITTDLCNFDCKYCYVQGNLDEQHKFSKMSVETAKKGLEMFLRQTERSHPKRDPAVLISGGEPLMNMEVVKFIIEYLRQTESSGRFNYHFEIMLVTNGALVTPKFATFAKDHGVTIGLSIDGPREIHDGQRIFRDGRGTFDSTFRAYNTFRKIGLTPGISCTLGPHNLDRLEEVTKWFISELKPETISFNIPLRTIVRETLSLSPEKVAEKLIRCFEIARDEHVYVWPMVDKMRDFVNEQPHVHHCGGGAGQQLTLAPDGSVGICQAFHGTRDYFDFTVEDDLVLREQASYLEWARRSPVNMEACIKCPALGICGGGCTYNAYTRHGSIWALDETFCAYSLKTLEWMIWDLHDKTQTSKDHTCTEQLITGLH